MSDDDGLIALALLVLIVGFVPLIVLLAGGL